MTQSTTSGHPSPTSAQKSPLASASTIASRVGSATSTTDHPCPSACHLVCQQIFFKACQLAKVQSEPEPTWKHSSTIPSSLKHFKLLSSLYRFPDCFQRFMQSKSKPAGLWRPWSQRRTDRRSWKHLEGQHTLGHTSNQPETQTNTHHFSQLQTHSFVLDQYSTLCIHVLFHGQMLQIHWPQW